MGNSVARVFTLSMYVRSPRKLQTMVMGPMTQRQPRGAGRVRPNKTVHCSPEKSEEGGMD